MAVLAIDLGASALRVAVAADGAARPVPMPDGTDEAPAVVAFASGNAQVGRAALGAAVTAPTTTVRGVARWLGSRPDDNLLARLRAEAGFGVSSRGDSLDFVLGSTRRSAVSVATAVCRHALAIAERHLGSAPTGVVFTHPLPDPRDREEALVSVAAELGLATVSTLPEPVAAAAGARSDRSERAVWIADVGASHMSIAAVQVRPDAEPEPLFVIGEDIGGDDVDRAIAERLVGPRLQGLDAGLRELVRQACEQMKIDLSAAPSMHCPAPAQLVPILGIDPSWTLDIAGLTDASVPLLQAVEACCERARGAARLGADAELYVIGGMARLGLVRARIEQAFGTRARALRAPGVLALGAARIALNAPPTRSPARMQARVSWRAPRLATPAPARFAAGPTAPGVATRAPARPPSAPLPGRPASTPASAPAPSHPSARTPASTPAPSTTPARTPGNAPAPARAPIPADTPAPVGTATARSAPASRNTPVPASASAPASAPPADPTLRAQPITRGASASVFGMNAGRIRNPTTPAELLQVPLARPIRQVDLDPIALPLLLLLTSNARRSGTLILRMDGCEPIEVPFVSGRALLAAAEVRALIDAFPSFTGTFSFTVGEPTSTGRRLEQRMPPLVFEGLRRLTRTFDPDAIEAAVGERMERAPVLRPAQQQAAQRLGLTEVERRLVSFAFNGRSAARSVIEHGGSRHTSLALLLLLALYDLVEWRAASTTTQPSLRLQLEERARQFDEANYFQVLGVHWSALEDEIHTAYRKIQDELSPGLPVFQIAPDACKRMLARAGEAYACLAEAQRRGAYRRRAYPDIDFEAAEELVERKRRALSLRDDGRREVKRLDRTMKEIARSKPKPRTLG